MPTSSPIQARGNASHLFLENRISDCLNTFLTGPLLDRGKRRWRMRENHL